MGAESMALQDSHLMFPHRFLGLDADACPASPRASALCLGKGKAPDWLNPRENVAGVDLRFDSQK